MHTEAHPPRSASGRVWLITGASSGLGRALTEAAIMAGDTVVAAARNIDPLKELIAAHPGQVSTLALDVTDRRSIPAAVEETLVTRGRIDILVNNAGRCLHSSVEETADGELRELLELHLFGPAALIRAVLPHLRSRKTGIIIQMSSMCGRFAIPDISAYAASKFALEGLSEALAAEVAQHGIKVLIVEPGAFRTNYDGGVGSQPGDPAKAAAAILEVISSPTMPLRLALGNDAVTALTTSLEKSLAELRTWETVSRSTDFG